MFCVFCVFSVVGVEWCKQNQAILPHSLVPNTGHATVLLTPEVNRPSEAGAPIRSRVAALLMILTQEKKYGWAHVLCFRFSSFFSELPLSEIFFAVISLLENPTSTSCRVID